MKDNANNVIQSARTRPTKDATITFRAPAYLDATLREIASREDRSLGYIVCKMLTQAVTEKGAWFAA